MSLTGAPIVYLFLECSALAAQRHFFETLIGLPLIEVEPHLPHHRHGVVKYDAGGIVLSLNLTGPSRFAKSASDALTTVFVMHGGPAAALDRLRDADVGEFGGIRREGDDVVFTDANGHHFRFSGADGTGDSRDGAPIARRFHLCVRDVAATIAFYAGLLGLAVVERDERRAVLDTGSVRLEVEERSLAMDGRRPRTSTSLIVFHTSDIAATTEALKQRGVTFRSQHAGFSEIGGTIRFDDPNGHRLCLYQPSDESLTWGSGPKVMEIGAGRALAR